MFNINLITLIGNFVFKIWFIYIASCICANFLSTYQQKGEMSVKSPCHLCPPLQVLEFLPDGYEIYDDFAIEIPQKSYLFIVDNNSWAHQAEAILKKCSVWEMGLILR